MSQSSQPPLPSTPYVRKVMQGNRSADTGPEIRLRSALHKRGLRFRKNAVPSPGLRCRADVVFPSARVVVFVDGCFWHRCPLHGTFPRANAEYWRAKFERNVARDRRNDAELSAAGWKVIRIWEHETVEAAADAVEAAVWRDRATQCGPAASGQARAALMDSFRALDRSLLQPIGTSTQATSSDPRMTINDRPSGI
jgi:DNA mismatch endonuclease (patch repair protein)